MSDSKSTEKGGLARSEGLKIRLMFAGPCDELSRGKKGYRKYLEKKASREQMTGISKQ